MDNKTALFLALAIIALFLADNFYLHWDIHLHLARRMIQLTDILAVWR